MIKGKHLIPTLLLVFFSIHSYGQDKEPRRVSVKKIEGKITVDGDLSEPEWGETGVTQPFWEQFPYDTSFSDAETEVKMVYNDQFLYVAIKCSDPEKGEYVTSSLRRDYRGRAVDGLTAIFDPFKNQNSTLFFGLTPFGVQREGIIAATTGGGRGNFDLSWDNKWYSEAKIQDGFWTAEMAIPFKTLRFKGGEDSWLVNFYRTDSKTATFSTWAHIPRNQPIFSPAFSGYMEFEEPLKKPGLNISVIPYIAGTLGQDFEEDENLNDFGIGGDVKIGITPSLNLDLTVNPDFSQVEVDVQQTNISRFELFFPERRQFFLENADLFASFGTNRIRPFFSRRIGIAEDENTGLNVSVPITYGARLSGGINSKWRVGLMNLQTSKDESINLPGFNYSVLALQRNIFARSNISFLVINKQATNTMGMDSTLDKGFDSDNYNRVIGLDYNLASDDNTWTGKLFYHHNFYNDGQEMDDFAHGFQLSYNIPWLQVRWDHQIVGDQYNPEVGFVPRNNFKRIRPEVEFKFYPSKGPIANHGPELSYGRIWNDEDGRTDQEFQLEYQIAFKTNARLRGSISNQYTYLFDDFDPFDGENGEALPEDTDYNYTSFNFNFESDQRKKFFYEIRSTVGGFFNGDLKRLAGNVNYRFQPYGVASVNFSYNRIDLPEPYASGTIFLIGPRFDITFTRKLFLTTFFQYNNQIDNININARLQYRYKPVSDFFLVYTENYFPDTFKSKNRALVAKFTYWLNM